MRINLTHRVGLLGALALIAGAAWTLIGLLAGCSVPTRVESLSIVSVPDSVRWIQQDKDSPYALVWANGTVNLWAAGKELQSCGYPSYRARTVRWSAAFAGSGIDTIRGTVTASWSDSGTVTGGDFWIVNEGDTVMRGLAETRLTGPCGSLLIPVTLQLVRAEP